MAHAIGNERNARTMTTMMTMMLVLPLLLSSLGHAPSSTMMITMVEGVRPDKAATATAATATAAATTISTQSTHLSSSVDDQKWSLKPTWSWVEYVVSRAFGKLDNLFSGNSGSTFFKIARFVFSYVGSFFKDTDALVRKFISWFLNSAINPLKGRFRSFDQYLRFSRFLLDLEKYLERRGGIVRNTKVVKCYRRVFPPCIRTKPRGKFGATVGLMYCTFRFVRECGADAVDIIGELIPPPPPPPPPQN